MKHRHMDTQTQFHFCYSTSTAIDSPCYLFTCIFCYSTHNHFLQRYKLKNWNVKWGNSPFIFWSCLASHCCQKDQISLQLYFPSFIPLVYFQNSEILLVGKQSSQHYMKGIFEYSAFNYIWMFPLFAVRKCDRISNIP